MTIDVDSSVLEAKRKAEKLLFEYPNVQTVGVGKKNDTDKDAIVVGVSEKVPVDQLGSGDVIPSSAEGVQTDVVEVGEIEPQILAQEIDRKGQHRPVPQGVSVGHPEVTAGSTGWMYKGGDGGYFIGSNNHVLANINNASVGDSILQPGTADGGTSDDQIGILAYFVPVEDGIDVDLALASPDGVDIDNSLAGVDKPIAGVVDSLSVGDELVKSGRTTGVTRGQIQQLDATVNVNYGGDLDSVQITGCILTGAMSQGGDSGSSVAKEVDGELWAAGRLFAGSSSVTVHHHIANELGHLQSYDQDIHLVTEDGSGGNGGGEPEPPTANVTLTLTKETPDTGNLVAEVTAQTDDGEDLGAVDAATVEIGGPVSRSADTNTDGIAAFEGIPLGTYDVAAIKDGYQSDGTSVTEGNFE